MRILICTKRDLHGAVILNHLLPALAGHQVLGVWLCDRLREGERDVPELATMLRLERTLPVEELFPQVDRLPPALAAQAPLATFKGLERRHGVAIEIAPDVNGPLAHKRLAALDLDLVLVARFSQIFKAETLALPRLGMVNAHPGHLPEYAGLYARLRACNDGADHFACSVHWVTPGIDAGPLLALHTQAIDPRLSLLEPASGLYLLAIPTLVATVAECAAGRRPAGVEQDLSLRRYRSNPGAADFAAMRQRGMRLWDEAAYLRALADFLPPGVALPPLALPAAPSAVAPE